MCSSMARLLSYANRKRAKSPSNLSRLAPAPRSTAEHCKWTVAPEVEGIVENAGNFKIKPPGGAETGRDGAAGRELELKHDESRKERRPRAGSGGGWGLFAAVRWAQRDITTDYRRFPSLSLQTPRYTYCISRKHAAEVVS